jgi:RNA polymerase sigma factor (sigma-70 family)
MVDVQLRGILRHLRATQVLSEAPDAELLQRFVTIHEEEPFAALVRRHGPMVWSVSRRVLPCVQDAEDVFQATFLLLARRAGSIRRAESVGSWLHGVAHRLALKLRQQDARRQSREKRAADMRRTIPEAATSLSDVQTIIDAALCDLPEKYRSALVLCYLEGNTHEEAARRLGCPLATVRTRVARGRKLLRDRLAKRGLILSSAGLAALLVASAAPAVAPAVLVKAAVQAALPFAAGQSAAALCSRQAAGLVEEGLQAMLLTKLKLATVLVLAAGLVAGAAALTQQGTAADEAAPPGTSQRPPAAQAKRYEAQEQGDSIAVSGRVVDPAGKAFPGATVFFARYILGERNRPAAAVTSDAQGRFRLRVSRTGYQEDYEKNLWLRGAVVAVGQGFAPGWVGADSALKLTNVTIKLGKDVPIHGRVVDLQGKPIAGVSVQLRNVAFREDGASLEDFVGALRSGQVRFGWWNHDACPRLRLDPGILGLPPVIHTGADGTFRLTGVGAECLVLLRFQGPTIETSEEYTLTRPGPTLYLPADKEQLGSRPTVFHGAAFEHAAAPTRPIVGVVRDKDTGKPLAGVTIQNEWYHGPGKGIALQTTTDENGRYRLVGLSPAAGHALLAVPPAGQPYLRAALTSGSTTGLGPVTVDFNLKRGVVLRGRVTDKGTGRPVPAQVTYFAFDDNPNVRQTPGYRDSHSIDVQTGPDGSFTLLGLAGRGLIAARAADRDQQGRYLMAVGADEIKGRRKEGDFVTHPNICDAPLYNTLVEVNPAEDAESLRRDVVLDPGNTVTGSVVGPDGKPVQGVSIDSVFGVWLHEKDLPTAQFRISGIDAKHPRSFYFRHASRNWGAAVLFNGDEPMPVTVRLQKCATLTGRLVNEAGKPCSAWISGYIHKGQLNINGGVGLGGAMQVTGKDGRFRLEGIIPGLKIGFWAGSNPSFYDQHLVQELTLQPGEVRDLGDLQRKASE